VEEREIAIGQETMPGEHRARSEELVLVMVQVALHAVPEDQHRSHEEDQPRQRGGHLGSKRSG